MVDYGQDKKYQVHVEKVDYYPELAGIKITNFPMIFVFSILPLWFNWLSLSLVVLFSLLFLFYTAARREDEGRPIFLHAKVIAILALTPIFLKKFLAPSLAHIKTHEKKFRR
jgi:hypothetical protein